MYYYYVLLLYYIHTWVKTKSFQHSLQTHLKSSCTNSRVDNGGVRELGGPKDLPATQPIVYYMLPVHYNTQTCTLLSTLININQHNHESGPKPPMGLKN